MCRRWPVRPNGRTHMEKPAPWSNYFDAAWLAKVQEDILDPEIAIIDTHHHLFSWPVHYLLPELMADLGSGHKVLATVHVEAHANYRSDGPEPLKPVGESEFLAHL